jgi:RHS repeat-associated protein
VITPGLEPNYTGYEYDQTLGIYYAKARFYDPATSRFIQRDPIEVGLNLYTYCNDNPVMFIDLFGLDAIWINGSDMTFAGHSSLLVEYKDSWHYFFYASNDAVLLLVDDESALESLDAFNIYHNTSKHFFHIDNLYDSATYISGDFSKSYEYIVGLQEVKDSLDKAVVYGNPNYNVVLNNCSQTSWDALQKGEFSDGTSIKTFMQSFDFDNDIVLSEYGPLPNVNTAMIQVMFQNNSFTKKGAMIQLQAKLDYYSSKSSFERWFWGYDDNISWLKKLMH